MKNIKLTEVLEQLELGKSREQIADHFGISMVECKRLFQHKDLKGKKAKKQTPEEFVLVDDLNTDTAEAEVENSEEATTESESDDTVQEEEETVTAETPSSPTWDN